ncbi:hypothetical protein KC573_00920 [candidate division WWE3 bacterium]|uniref:Uncharacterized protein n=1 Tax=candidate division WWE3 bacterium TaxID=2053526 RepID=A0A955LW84_UNCKA|nr:hypothetical protein [candidate division WWE3 bacterium]
MKKHPQTMHNIKKNFSNKGFVALFVVVIISAGALLMSYNASYLSLGELDLGVTNQKGYETLAIAEGCAEEALGQIRQNSNYGLSSGTIQYTVGSGSCTVTVTDIGGNQRQITSSATVTNYHKRVQVILTIGSTLSIDSWTEL